MTAEGKTAAARFLDLASACLRGGYRGEDREYRFEEDTPPDAPAADSLAAVAGEIGACVLCPLCRTRTNTVPGEGADRPLVMVIGEGPGADEDATGRPFVGKAGQLLDRMLASIGLFRDKNCFIANVVKCRPPENRNPFPEEMLACAPFLGRQIEVLRPKLIFCMGKVAANKLLNNYGIEAMGKLRGRFFSYGDIPLIATYHPSAVLRDSTLRKPVWDDLRILSARLAELDGDYRPPHEAQDLPGRTPSGGED
jgi:DNA polymerase